MSNPKENTKTKKVVINYDFGGFSISKEAAEFMAKRGNERARAELDDGGRWFGYGVVSGLDGKYERDDPDLVAAVEELGKKSWGEAASLKVIEIPSDITWSIQEYDGAEWVAEDHRVWG